MMFSKKTDFEDMWKLDFLIKKSWIKVQKLYLDQVNRKHYDSYVFPFRRTDSEDKLEFLIKRIMNQGSKTLSPSSESKTLW